MRFKKLKSLSLASALIIGTALLVGCSSKEEKQADKASSGYEPFTLETYETEVTYDKVPETIVSFNSHTTENLFALGLGEKIIGISYNNAEISPEYKEDLAKIKVLAEKYPSMEVLLGENPEFVYGRNSAFSEKGVGTVSDMVDNGITPYVSKATYTEGATMEDVYEDFENLGEIFKIEDKAEELINSIQEEISDVQEKMSSVEEKKNVFVYDSGEEQAFTAGKSLETNLIELAGGVNIFGDLEKTWEKVNWETVVERNPDYIIINDYGTKTVQEKINFLKTHPAMKDIKAVKEEKFIVLPLSSTFAGIRNDDAVKLIAQGLYPEVFEK